MAVKCKSLIIKNFEYPMLPWCKNNLSRYWNHGTNSDYKPIFWFESEEDMVKFILKWL